MILGIGNDLTDIRRIEQMLAEFGERFERRVFTGAERAAADRRRAAGAKARASTLAKRFAAKEAGAKALGTGFRGLSWLEMDVLNLPSGKPALELSGKALSRLREITPEGWTPQIDLTMTDEYPFAQAIVIISALKL